MLHSEPFLLGPDSDGVIIALVILLALGFLTYVYVGEEVKPCVPRSDLGKNPAAFSALCPLSLSLSSSPVPCERVLSER